ncbi:MAG: hypothetical protein JW834_01550, partial [Candidatus Diapherotrites archaeon]|nr:hypothetical protein [Candidatus Diapherotrites archaeon]
MPRYLYLHEIREHVSNHPLSVSKESFPGTRMKVGGTRIKLVGILHTQIARASKALRKAHEEAKTKADVTLLEDGLDSHFGESDADTTLNPEKGKVYTIEPRVSSVDKLFLKLEASDIFKIVTLLMMGEVTSKFTTMNMYKHLTRRNPRMLNKLREHLNKKQFTAKTMERINRSRDNPIKEFLY